MRTKVHLISMGDGRLCRFIKTVCNGYRIHLDDGSFMYAKEIYEYSNERGLFVADENSVLRHYNFIAKGLRDNMKHLNTAHVINVDKVRIVMGTDGTNKYYFALELNDIVVRERRAGRGVYCARYNEGVRPNIGNVSLW